MTNCKQDPRKIIITVDPMIDGVSFTNIEGGDTPGRARRYPCQPRSKQIEWQKQQGEASKYMP